MIELDESQGDALMLISTAGFSIVTGGPGTGKTTILSAALDALDEAGKTYVLCSPTGKAAKRMEEATGRPASTIHRALAYHPEETPTGLRWVWGYCRTNPLPADVVFVDEASMLDVHLFARLLEAIHPATTRLVLVGDANQLPSVGPGAVFSDLVGLPSTIPCARLTQVHRSAAGSWICQNAPTILKGQSVPLDDRADFRFVNVEDASTIGDVCAREMKSLDGQVLAPQRTGVAGTEAINETIQRTINPERPGEVCYSRKGSGKSPGVSLRVGDRVIHTRNNYTLGVFNGEIGEVVAASKVGVNVKYPDREGSIEYTGANVFDLKLAYALTIHKSQGSEWPWAIVVVHSTHSFMLTRRLIYTAITRGKTGVVIVGNRKGVEAAIRNDRDAKRNTSLADRILAATPDTL